MKIFLEHRNTILFSGCMKEFLDKDVICIFGALFFYLKSRKRSIMHEKLVLYLHISISLTEENLGKMYIFRGQCWILNIHTHASVYPTVLCVKGYRF